MFNKIVIALTIILLTTTAFISIIFNTSSISLLEVLTSIFISDIAIISTAADAVLLNRITIYEGNSEIQSVVEEFSRLWEKGEEFADVSQKEWIRISLKSDWEQYVLKTARVYPLKKDAKEVVDKIFDKLQK